MASYVIYTFTIPFITYYERDCDYNDAVLAPAQSGAATQRAYFLFFLFFFL